MKHPDTKKIVYVGKSFNPIARYYHHSRGCYPYKSNLGKLRDQLNGKKMILYLIEMIENKGKKYVEEKERYWIKKMVESGCQLLNKAYPNRKEKQSQ